MYLFYKNEETTLDLLRKVCEVCAVSTQPTRTHPGKKLNLPKMHRTTYEINFCCDVLKNEF